MIVIDGSIGEGGGQVVRTAVSLSALTGESVTVSKIRAGRESPGLKAQHLYSIKALKELCNAKVRGLSLHSTEIEFIPGKIRPGTVEVGITTAGSCGLALQTLMLPAAHAGGEVEILIRGGATFGMWSPPLDYAKNLLCPVLERMGFRYDAEVMRHGFCPKGGAQARVIASPVSRVRPVRLEGGDEDRIVSAQGVSAAEESLRNARVSERMAEAAKKGLAGLKADIDCAYESCPSVGCGITLWSVGEGHAVGSSALGERGVTAEKVGASAASELLSYDGFGVDGHLSDQLLPFMALSEGESVITARELTSHAETNMLVIKKFIDKDFSVSRKEKKGRKFVEIRCS